MRRCRKKNGQFTKCSGRASASSGRRKSKRKTSCKFGVSKTTGRCLKRKRSR